MMRMLLFSLAACLLAAMVHGDTVTVTTPLGDLEGIQMDNYAAFLGIPFAQPPVGSLRWENPQPASPWDGTRSALEFGSICPGTEGTQIDAPMDEDCLYLNVWTPAVNATKLPVMVFIYGGGWTQGYSNEGFYMGDFFANTTGTVLVTFNYRLGALGFMVSTQLTGNYGFLDQREALHWVQNNIASFGGDPERVTIFGQSAGAISVGLHLVSSGSNNLFQRAIMESNPYAIQYRSQDQSEPYAVLLSGLLNCTVTDLTCLRSRDWQDIIAAQLNTVWLPFPLSTTQDLPWQPTLDGTVIEDQPLTLMATGLINNVTEVIIGTVRNETVSFLYGNDPKPIPSFEYELGIDHFFNNMSEVAMKLYPCVTDCRSPVTQLTTDFYFVCPSRMAARLLSAAGIRTREYAFLYAPIIDPINNTSYCRGQVCHGAELVYVFHSPAFVPGFHFMNDAEVALSWQVMDWWTRFAAGTLSTAEWPLYDVTSNQLMAIDIPNSTVVSGYHNAGCNLMDWTGGY